MPLTKIFCDHLEYRLTQAFQQSNRQDIKGFWCDGVSGDILWQAETDTGHRYLVTKAWIGKDGQGPYETTVWLGPLAAKRYDQGDDMVDVIPSVGSMEWVKIEPSRHVIAVFLA